MSALEPGEHLLTVICHICVEDGSPTPSRLGNVRLRDRSWLWVATNARAGKIVMHQNPNKLTPEMAPLVGAILLMDPASEDYAPPDTLPARCARHGLGSVRTSAVMDALGVARGRRRSAVLAFSKH